MCPTCTQDLSDDFSLDTYKISYREEGDRKEEEEERIRKESKEPIGGGFGSADDLDIPKLKGTEFIDVSGLPKKEVQRLHYLGPSKDRWKLRSTTYKGIAEAMATQFSDYLLSLDN